MTNCENFPHAACQTSKLDVFLFKPTNLEEHFGSGGNVCMLLLLKRVYFHTLHTPFVKNPLQFFLNLLPLHSHTPTPSSHCYYIRKCCLREEVQYNPAGGLDSESQSEGKWLYHLFFLRAAQASLQV